MTTHRYDTYGDVPVREDDFSAGDAANESMAHNRFSFPPTLIRWGAVFGGAIIAYAFMALWTSLWGAFANDPATGAGWFEGSINWWIGATGITSMFLGGLIAGWLSGVRGFIPGALHGVTTWGLLIVASSIINLPGSNLANVQSNLLFTVFWTLLIGLGTALVGGVVGGLLPQPAGLRLGERGSRSLHTAGVTEERTERIVR